MNFLSPDSPKEQVGKEPDAACRVTVDQDVGPYKGAALCGMD